MFEVQPVSDVTQISSQIEAGDGQAAENLLPLVYDELRKLAAEKMAAEKPGQTLQATALSYQLTTLMNLPFFPSIWVKSAAKRKLCGS